MPDIYKTGLSPLIELARAALPGKRVVTAEDLTQLLDPTTGAQRRVRVGGLNMQVHPEEWRALQGPDIVEALRNPMGRYTREDVVDWLREPIDETGRTRNFPTWDARGKGHESYTLPGPRTNYRVRGLGDADGLTDSGDYSYHFADAPVHVRLSTRAAPVQLPNDREELIQKLMGLRSAADPNSPENATRAFEAGLRRYGPEDLSSFARRYVSEGGHPRATHIDELQSDFYSMRPNARNLEDLMEQIRTADRAEREAYMRDPSMMGEEYRQAQAATSRLRGQIEDATGDRPLGPYEKLWPRLAFNQVAREALEKGDDLVTWSPPWVHDRLYRETEPGVSPLGMMDDGIRHTIRVTPETFRSDPDILNLYRGPQSQAFRDWAQNPSGDFILESGNLWRDPNSLMYHNVYGPNGVVEDAARRFLRSYGEDPKAGLTTTKLQGGYWPADSRGVTASQPEVAVPGMRISESMRDIFKRLRDDMGAGVPLYAEGGSVTKPITLEAFIMGGHGETN